MVHELHIEILIDQWIHGNFSYLNGTNWSTLNNEVNAFIDMPANGTWKVPAGCLIMGHCGSTLSPKSDRPIWNRCLSIGKSDTWNCLKVVQAKKLKEKVVWNFQIALTYCNSVAAHRVHYKLNASVAMTTLIQPHSGVVWRTAVIEYCSNRNHL